MDFVEPEELIEWAAELENILPVFSLILSFSSFAVNIPERGLPAEYIGFCVGEFLFYVRDISLQIGIH